MKKILMLVVLLGLLVLTACTPVQGVAQGVVELPIEIQAVIGLAVLYGVGLLLRGRVPDELVMEISAAITTGIITVLGLVLRLIPTEFEAVANSVLNLIVVLLGMLQLTRGVLVAFGKKQFAQRVHLLK